MKHIHSIIAKKKLNDKGFSLVELIISIAILVIIMLPLMSNFIRSMQMNKKAERYQIQSNLAASVMEGVKAFEIEDVIDQFSGSIDDFDIMSVKDQDDNLIVTSIMRLNDEYNPYMDDDDDDDVTFYYFAINGFKMEGHSYDLVIELDTLPYKRENEHGEDILNMNNYPMPEIMKPDKKASGLLFSDGSSIYHDEVLASNQMDYDTLDAFINHTEALAKVDELYHESNVYKNYLNALDNWQRESIKALQNYPPLPIPSQPIEPGISAIDQPDVLAQIDEYTKEDKIKELVTKSMVITVEYKEDDAEDKTIVSNIDYEIIYKVDWDNPITISYSIDSITYAQAIQNVYLFFNKSIFHTSPSFDTINIIHKPFDDDFDNPVNFFVASQEEYDLDENPITLNIDTVYADNIFTDISPYIISGLTLDRVNNNVINTYDLDRIYDITVSVYESEAIQADRYNKLYYSLNSTKER